MQPDAWLKDQLGRGRPGLHTSARAQRLRGGGGNPFLAPPLTCAPATAGLGSPVCCAQLPASPSSPQTVSDLPPCAAPHPDPVPQRLGAAVPETMTFLAVLAS